MLTQRLRGTILLVRTGQADVSCCYWLIPIRLRDLIGTFRSRSDGAGLGLLTCRSQRRRWGTGRSSGGRAARISPWRRYEEAPGSGKARWRSSRHDEADAGHGTGSRFPGMVLRVAGGVRVPATRGRARARGSCEQRIREPELGVVHGHGKVEGARGERGEGLQRPGTARTAGG